MTAIVGFVEKNSVWIGGDSAGVSGYNLTSRADHKIFRNGDFLFGFTSSFRMGQILRFSFSPPKPTAGQDVYQFMCTAFIDGVRNVLKAGGYAEKEKERESGGDFLVGYRGRLFLVGSDYQVGESLDHYDACGCGAEVAKGALFATANVRPSDRRMKLVLEATERHNAGVRRPFVIECLK